MSFNLNVVMLAGHITKNPEFKQLAPDRVVCNFGLAVNKRYKDKQGNLKDEVLFVDCEAWGRTAELVAQYLTKGSACYVEGALKLDTWDGPNGKVYKLKVVASGVQFISTKAPADVGPGPATQTNPEPTETNPF